MTGIIEIQRSSAKQPLFELEDNSVHYTLRVEALDFLRGSQSQAMNSLYAALMQAKTGEKFVLFVELAD